MPELAVEQQNRRAFERERRQDSAIDQAADRAVQQLKKELVKRSRQAVLRIINVSFAATIVGIGVTYLIMSVQLFVGNLMGNELIELEGWEILIWAFLSILILAVFLILATTTAFLSHPWQTAILGWEAISTWLFN